MTEPPPTRRRKIVRFLGILATLPAGILVLLLLWFVHSTEAAFDESTCPFTGVGEREIAPSVIVVEERRVCQPDVEERRWTARRADTTTELGRRRLRTDRFAPAVFRWRGEVSGDDVLVTIENDGLPTLQLTTRRE